MREVNTSMYPAQMQNELVLPGQVVQVDVSAADDDADIARMLGLQHFRAHRGRYGNCRTRFNQDLGAFEEQLHGGDRFFVSHRYDSLDDVITKGQVSCPMLVNKPSAIVFGFSCGISLF